MRLLGQWGPGRDGDIQGSIFITGDPTSTDIIEFFKREQVYFIPKPIDMKELSGMIQKLLEEAILKPCSLLSLQMNESTWVSKEIKWKLKGKRSSQNHNRNARMCWSLSCFNVYNGSVNIYSTTEVPASEYSWPRCLFVCFLGLTVWKTAAPVKALCLLVAV